MTSSDLSSSLTFITIEKMGYDTLEIHFIWGIQAFLEQTYRLVFFFFIMIFIFSIVAAL